MILRAKLKQVIGYYDDNQFYHRTGEKFVDVKILAFVGVEHYVQAVVEENGSIYAADLDDLTYEGVG